MLKFYHAPWSRSSAVLWLLEELGIDYEVETVDIRAQVPESYRSVQPNKKVPAIDHDGTIVTERAAITLYLAETFPDAELNVPSGHPDRARYLTMLVYCDSVFDPSLTAKAKGWQYVSNDFSFGLFDDMVGYVEKVLSERPFAAGGRFTAADIQLASSIGFTMGVLKVLPQRAAFVDYLARIGERPAWQRAQTMDQELAMATPYFKAQFNGQARD